MTWPLRGRPIVSRPVPPISTCSFSMVIRVARPRWPSPASIRPRSRPPFGARGFELAPDARSNYVTTRLTLPAVFASAHLLDIPSLRQPGTRQGDAHVLREATESGVVLSTLGAAGYERIAVASGYGEIGPRRVDRLIVPPQIGEFEASLLRSTMVGRIVDFLAPNAAASEKHERVEATFQEAALLAREPHDRPRFVFVHVPGPHGPWVVDASRELLAGHVIAVCKLRRSHQGPGDPAPALLRVLHVHRQPNRRHRRHHPGGIAERRRSSCCSPITARTSRSTPTTH